MVGRNKSNTGSGRESKLKQSTASFISMLSTIFSALLCGIFIAMAVSSNSHISQAKSRQIEAESLSYKLTLLRLREKTALELYAQNGLSIYSAEYEKYSAELSEAIPEQAEAAYAEVSALDQSVLALGNNSAEAMKILSSDDYLAKNESFINAVADYSKEIKNTEEKAIKSTEGTILTEAILAAAMLLMMAINSFFYVMYVRKKLIKPIRRVTEIMVAMNDGDLSVSSGLPKDKTELGELGEALHNAKKYIRKIAEDLSYCLGEIAKGNVNFSVGMEYRGEYGPIKIALNQILDNLNDSFREIRNAADQVMNGSLQIADGAETLAQGTTTQAGTLEELSASIAEIANRVQKNAGDSKGIDELFEKMTSELNENDEQMQATISAMDEISDKSKEIVKIIKEIDNIAFQTNILALNAAVEAARAGNAGKGFAVVADEVGVLAGRSAESAKNTAALIKDAIIAVSNGSKLAAATAESLKGVVGLSQESSRIMNGFSEASISQNLAISEIKSGIEQISNVVQTNSATAQQSSAASQELSAQAKNLDTLVRQFKLRD